MKASVREMSGADIEVVPVEGVPRGVVWVNPRDYEDAFTFKPTRTDLEMGQMMEAASRLKVELGDIDEPAPAASIELTATPIAEVPSIPVEDWLTWRLRERGVL